jgi:hypothetical protein
MAEQFSEESEDVAPAPAPAPSSKKPEREGLPPGYRMRADAHYVEHLTSRRGDRAQGEQHRAASDPIERHDTRDRSERLLAQLAEDIATIESAAAGLATETSRMAKRVNVDLIKSQTWRAAWLLKAHAILGGAHRGQIRPRPLGFLLGHVRSGWAPECRLAGITMQVQASDWNAVVAVDELGLLAGLTGALVSTLGLIGQTEGATITLNAVAGSGELRFVDVVQEEVLIAPSISGRFFDASWIDRPGGWLAGLGAATAKAVAIQHGGDAVFLAGERHGSTVRLQLSKA